MEEGVEVRCCVLDVDVEEMRVAVSLNPKLVEGSGEAGKAERRRSKIKQAMVGGQPNRVCGNYTPPSLPTSLSQAVTLLLPRWLGGAQNSSLPSPLHTHSHRHPASLRYHGHCEAACQSELH